MRRRFASLVVLAVVLTIGAPQQARADNVALGLRITGVGASVSTVPSGSLISCRGARCFYVFPRGTRVTLTATPRPGSGSSFAKWLGCPAQASPTTCTIVLDASKNVTARFSPVLLYADQQTGHGNVFASPEGRSCGYLCWSYPYGTQVTVSAQPTDGYGFGGWRGACSGVSSDACVVTLYDNVQTSPMFSCPPDVCDISQPIERTVYTTLIVRGGGYVVVNGKRCGPNATCRIPFNRGVLLVFRAYTRGTTFRGWSGWCRGRSPCQFQAFRDAYQNLPRVIAYFG
jgi:hypothetical protein